MQVEARRPAWRGLSPVIWLMLGGGVLLLWLFVAWENRRLERGEGAAPRPVHAPQLQLRGGVASFFFLFLVQAGVFFVVPLFLSVALGMSAVATGVRLLPLSLMLLPRRRRAQDVAEGLAAPRRSPRIPGCSSPASAPARLLDYGAGAEIVTWPLLFAALGIGAIASQLGADDRVRGPRRAERRGGRAAEHGDKLGASIGTALAGAVLISALTASFISGIQNNAAVPDRVVKRRHRQAERAGCRSSPTTTSRPHSTDAHVRRRAANAIVDQNEESRIDGLRVAVAILALFTLLALPFTRGIPTVQPGAESSGSPPT